MKKYTLATLILVIGVVLNVGIAWGQDDAKNISFAELIKTKKKTSLKPLAFVQKTDGEYTTPSFSVIFTDYGSFSKDIRHLKISRQQLEKQLHNLLGFDQNYALGQLRTIEDELGFLHTNYQVYYRGYLVDGQAVMIHEQNGIVTSINGVVKAIDTKTDYISISDEQAVKIAMKHIGVSELIDQYPVENVLVRTNRKFNSVFSFAKRVKIFSIKPLKKYYVYVDVANGEVVKQVSLLHHTDVQRQAATYYNGTQTITCDSVIGAFRFKDNARNIATYNGANWTGTRAPSSALMYRNSTDVWTADSLKPAVQIHWAMEKTYDYYLNVHNRNSYDGNHGTIYNIYNPVVFDGDGMNMNAAALTGYGIMLYGRGGTYGNVTYNPLVAFDIAGHEFAHLVTDNSNGGGLEYEGESGALNESFSDIFAVCIDFYSNPTTANWIVGEDIFSTANTFIRSLSDPSTAQLSVSDRQPDTYQGEYWEFDPDVDNGGVHTNSGVQNHWFYLLCQGGSGTNDNGDVYNVNPIGIEDARSIAYRNLMFYLSNTAQHIDAYNGSLRAVEDLFPNDAEKRQAVIDAWYAVGVDSIPTTGCSGTTTLTDNYGQITDGSGRARYDNNRDCKWLIQVADGRIISLSFTSFDTEASYDHVSVYDGATTSATLLGRFSGNSIPTATLTSSSNAMLVRFVSDVSQTGQGFDATYTSSNPNSVDLAATDNLMLFPNPASDAVSIKVGNYQGQTTVIVRDMHGKTVQQSVLNNVIAGEPQNIDIKHLNAGIYTVQVINDIVNKVEKLVIRK